MTGAPRGAAAEPQSDAATQIHAAKPRVLWLRQHAVQLLLVLAAAVVLLRLLDVTVIHRRTPALAVVLLADPLAVDCGALETELYEALGFDAARDIVTVTAYSPDAQQTEQIVITELRAHAVDLVIAAEDAISEYNKKGCFEEPLYQLPRSGSFEALSGLTAGIAVTTDHRDAALRALSHFNKGTNGANSGGET